MSKKRISSSQVSSGGRDLGFFLKQSLRKKKFLGISLAGGKTDKTCLAVVEYFQDQKKIFLSHLEQRIQARPPVSADQVLVDEVKRLGAELLAFDVPLALPKCIRCRLKCPGYEECREPEILWFWKNYKAQSKTRKPVKLFTPYTERCVETFLRTELEEPFHLSHALGANAAPLTARAVFLQKRLRLKAIEVSPKVSLWRIGIALGIQKSHLRYHKHAIGGDEARAAILERLIQRKIAFFYDQDVKIMTENAQAFDAFLCALTAVLKFRKQTCPRPEGFPKGESWIEIPLPTLEW